VLLHKALSDAVRWGLVARNAADAADPPRVPRQERGAWSAEELRAFLEATSDDRLAAMWLLLPPPGCAAASCSACPGGRSTWRPHPGGSPSSRQS
jgi:hypothetical protein